MKYTKWHFIIDTNTDAMLIGSDLAAFLTGFVSGDEYLGEVEGVQMGIRFSEEVIDLDYRNFMSRSLDWQEHDGADTSQPWDYRATPGWYMGKCDIPTTTPTDDHKIPACCSISLTFLEEPSDLFINILKSRALAFPSACLEDGTTLQYVAGDLKITGFRLLKETTEVTEEEIWSQVLQ